MADYCDAENKLRHYEVLSGVMVTGGYMEPPEPWQAWANVLAPNAAKAKVMALRGEGENDGKKDWDRWRRECAGTPPFKGMTARLARCEHGACWMCGATDSSSGCATCDAEAAASEAEEIARSDERAACAGIVVM